MRRWIIVAIAAIVVLCIVLVLAGQGGQPGTTSRPAPTPWMAWLSGIEKEGPSKGELVLTEINLWARPGDLTVEGQKVVGKLPHATQIEILSTTTWQNRQFYEIRGRNVQGWVSDSFVVWTNPTP